MNIQLTQKETMLLKDQQSHEEMCIKKYNNYANQAQDPQLKQLFKDHASQEQQHLDSINQLLNGQIPNTGQQNQQQSQQQNQQTQQNIQSANQNQNTANNSMDADLCNDLLMTEKYVSATYNTAIFEFTNTNVRQILNHIQKEEQQHGEDIFNYMQSHGMYQPQ
ncbi:coat F domain-containing protein [Clostridium aceticum]|uniref:Coat F domain-containing protein n=1 Tax=Clostridium aceticum TaxID=84022 RepID=A0A0D8IBD1_9CLOT|nr:DUF892 family protein [Clostridium aceticum]AKL96844.1 coat F domain-containing protein [Clostridium aceticum]KJF27588.1 coat protein F [Clostridium aceticum]